MSYSFSIKATSKADAKSQLEAQTTVPAGIAAFVGAAIDALKDDVDGVVVDVHGHLGTAGSGDTSDARVTVKAAGHRS